MSSLNATARVILGLLKFSPRTGYDVNVFRLLDAILLACELWADLSGCALRQQPDSCMHPEEPRAVAHGASTG